MLRSRRPTLKVAFLCGQRGRDSISFGPIAAAGIQPLPPDCAIAVAAYGLPRRNDSTCARRQSDYANVNARCAARVAQ